MADPLTTTLVGPDDRLHFKNPKTATSISNSKFLNKFPKFGSPSKKKTDKMQTIANWKNFLQWHPHRIILSSFQVEIEAFNLSDKILMKIHTNYEISLRFHLI